MPRNGGFPSIECLDGIPKRFGIALVARHRVPKREVERPREARRFPGILHVAERCVETQKSPHFPPRLARVRCADERVSIPFAARSRQCAPFVAIRVMQSRRDAIGTIDGDAVIYRKANAIEIDVERRRPVRRGIVDVRNTRRRLIQSEPASHLVLRAETQRIRAVRLECDTRGSEQLARFHKPSVILMPHRAKGAPGGPLFRRSVETACTKAGPPLAALASG